MTFPTVALGEIFDIARGGSPRPIDQYLTEDSDGLNWVLIGDATRSGKYIHSTEKRIKREGLKKSRAVEPGDFLLSNSMSFGRPYIMATHGCIHDGWLVLRNGSKHADPDYLYHLLGSQPVYREFVKRAPGTTVKNLNTEIVRETRIPLPPLAEQKRIAAALDEAELLLNTQRSLMARLYDLERAFFDDVVGDPVSNLKSWPVFKLEQVTEGQFGIKAGPFGSSLKKSDYTKSGYRVYGQEQVIAGRFDVGDYYIDKAKFLQLQSCSVREDDVLVSLVGSFGKVLVVPPNIEPGIINPRLVKITPNTGLVTPLYISLFLKHPSVQKALESRSHGGTMGILNAGILRTVPVPVPPMQLQLAIGRQLKMVLEVTGRVRNRGVYLDRLKAALAHRAFRGDL